MHPGTAVVRAEDYLAVRRPAWRALEAARQIMALGGQVYIATDETEVIEALVREYPYRYQLVGVRVMPTAFPRPCDFRQPIPAGT